MKRHRDKPASALLMVVGLLTILGMLGGTFLVVASMHRRASASLAATAPLDDMPAGILNQIVSILREDLHIAQIPDTEDQYAPYAGTTGHEDVPMYADSPGTDDILDKEKMGDALFAGAGKGAQVDTDGNGEPDAYLYPTGVFNSDGDEICVAVNVVDLSSMICVNTGYGKTAGVTPVSPVRIGLKELVGDAIFTALHAERCATGASGVADFNENCALKLASPVGAYEPFSIEDELFLRWLKGGAATNTGRLYSVITDFAGRGLLTTTARSRSILRHPEADRKARLLISSLAALDDLSTRNWLLAELYKILGEEAPLEPGDEIIVDNLQGTPTGSWTISQWSPGYHGINYQHDGNADKGLKSFTFTPSLATAGQYEVHMQWPDSDIWDTNVPVDITHSSGTSTVTVNQTTGGGQWNLLGTYSFGADTGGNVTIRTAGTVAHVAADAVKLVLVEAVPSDPPDPPDPFTVDNANPGAPPTGSWTESTWSPGYYASNYQHDGNTGKGLKSFTFAPTVPVAGQYKVYMQWPESDIFAQNVPVDIIHDGGTSTVSVDESTNGGQWNLLGTYSFGQGTSGKLVIRTTGTTSHVAADAVQFVCTGVRGAVDTTVVDHFVANLWAYLSQRTPGLPDNETFKVKDAYGVIPQLVITEAYAYSFADDPATTPEDESGWAYAIELMNPTNEDVDASNYSLICGGLSWDFSGSVGNVGAGSRVVIYDFGGQIGGSAADVDDFGFSGGHRAEGKLDFSTGTGGGAVRIVRVVPYPDGDEIPVDAITSSDLEDLGYTIINKQNNDGGAEEVIAVGQRDDNLDRGRALVAKMKKLTSLTIKGHSLGESNSDNGLTGNEPEFDGVVYQGFFINKATAVPATLGELIARYITGPTVDETSDLPHKLVEHMASATRGKIDYNCAPAAWPGDYPALPWPTTLGELLELVQPHTNVEKKVENVIYGRINVSMAPEDVLAQLPFPASITVGLGAQQSSHDVSATDAANAIFNGRPYSTPGAVAVALGNYAGTLLSGKEGLAHYPEARNSLYNAISNLITTNSDTFAVYIQTQIGNDPNSGARHHVAVIDRSNCIGPDDEPKVLMFAEIK